MSLISTLFSTPSPLWSSIEMWMKKDNFVQGTAQGPTAEVIATYSDASQIGFQNRGELHFTPHTRLTDIQSVLTKSPDCLEVSFEAPVDINTFLHSMTHSIKMHLQIALQQGGVSGVKIEDQIVDYNKYVEAISDSSSDLASKSRNPFTAILRATWDAEGAFFVKNMDQKLLWYGPDYNRKNFGNHFRVYFVPDHPEIARLVTYLAISGFPVPDGIAPQKFSLEGEGIRK